MENTLSVVLMIVFLLIGAVGGVVLAPEKEVIKEVEKEVFVDKLVTEYVEVSAPNQLDLALIEFLNAVEDEEDAAGHDVDVLGDYKFDEFEVTKLYNAYSVEYNDEITTVNFEVKIRLKEDDESAEKLNYDVTVIFEEDEDTEVVATLLV